MYREIFSSFFFLLSRTSIKRRRVWRNRIVEQQSFFSRCRRYLNSHTNGFYKATRVSSRNRRKGRLGRNVRNVLITLNTSKVRTLFFSKNTNFPTIKKPKDLKHRVDESTP